ncbi:BQ5605_C008g05080 [Microbotryum silenes-dioicae]|uniref:BQ5605_C008g05080 protein n=1 Tax=Microbotryum silenes-dioicae TaxID=796604 RepID=A0A2X0MG90_9BASI|nr:BQ5605_C008g05080 [Microbotryum silenes-dioicae]
MDVAKEAVESLQTEFKNGAQVQYLQICRAVATGFVIMGGIGYVVKLVHIPINNILVGGS